MPKRLALLLLSLALTGCGTDEPTQPPAQDTLQPITYEETITDGHVTIDGVSYPIVSISETTIAYDAAGNPEEKISDRDGEETRVLLTHENDLLTEEVGFRNGEEIFTHRYLYEDDRLVEKTTVYPGGLETKTQITYDDGEEIHAHYNADGSLSFLVRVKRDEADRVVELVQESNDGEIVSRTHQTYENGLLSSVTEKRKETLFREAYYTYNQEEDPISLYQVTHAGEEHMLTALFYDYQYNDDGQPIEVRVHRVHSPIEEQDLRTH